MDDVSLYQKLGELTAEVRGVNRRIDEALTALNKQDERLGKLEEDRTYYAGTVKGMRWLVTTAFTIASALGAERIAALIGWHNV